MKSRQNSVRSCRTCRWVAVPSGERIYKTRTYPCNWPMPDLPLPDSITRYFRYQPYPRSRMEPDDGKNCPTWEKRDA